jgi:hypothetical protein
VRNLYILLDADGCVYNHKYHLLLAHLIDQFGGDIQNFLAVGVSSHEKRAAFAAKLRAEISHYDFGKVSAKLLGDLNEKVATNLSAQQLDADILAKLHRKSGRHLAVKRQYLRWLQEIDPIIVDDILAAANDSLFTDIAHTISAEADIANVVFMVASNRQSVKFDRVNCEKKATRSYFHDLPVLVRRCENMLRQHGFTGKVSLDKFLMADVFGNMTDGISFELSSMFPPHHVIHPHTFYDETKVSLIYALIHRIAANTEAEDGSLVHYYDDQLQILRAVDTVLGWNTKLLVPEFMQLKLCHYKGDGVESSRHISGDAVPDLSYRESVRLIASLCGADPLDIQGFKTDVMEKLSVTEFLSFRNVSQEVAALEVSTEVHDNRKAMKNSSDLSRSSRLFTKSASEEKAAAAAGPRSGL